MRVAQNPHAVLGIGIKSTMQGASHGLERDAQTAGGGPMRPPTDITWELNYGSYGIQ